TVKWINERRIQPVVVAYDEMARQSDALHGSSQSPRDLEIYQRKCNGDAGARRQHGVEAAVSRIVVVTGIAAKAELIEQVTIGFLDVDQPVARVAQASAQLARVCIQHGDERTRLQFREFNRGHFERGTIQSYAHIPA